MPEKAAVFLFSAGHIWLHPIIGTEVLTAAITHEGIVDEYRNPVTRSLSNLTHSKSPNRPIIVVRLSLVLVINKA